MHALAPRTSMRITATHRFRHAAIPHVILFTFAFFWQTFLCHNIGFCSGEIYFVAEAVPLRCGKRAKDKLCGFQFWCTVFGVICWQSAMGIYRAAQVRPTHGVCAVSTMHGD